MRDVTERPEAVEAGVVRLVGTRPESIVNSVREVLAGPPVPELQNPYGDGRAAERIVQAILADA